MRERKMEIRDHKTDSLIQFMSSGGWMEEKEEAL